MSDPSGEALFDIRRYARLFRSQKSVILLAVTFTVSAALSFVFFRPRIYSAASQVLVEPISVENPTQAAPLPSLDTEAAIVQSTEVARWAGDAMGSIATPDALLSQVSVELPGDAQSLIVSFKATDPIVAQRGAEAFARAYLQFKRERAQAGADTIIANYQAELDSLHLQLAQATRRLAEELVGSAAYENAVARRDVLKEQVSALTGRLTLVRTVNIDPGEVIVEASRPTAPEGPGVITLTVLGLLLGLFLGGIVAFLRDRLDERPRGRLDLEETVNAPVLALVPKVRNRSKGLDELVVLRAPQTPAAEAYRMAAANVLAMTSGDQSREPTRSDLKTFLVVSPLDTEGKTMTAANLGAELALGGRRVLLISADLRKGRLHELFGLPNNRGLSQLLAGEIDDWKDVSGSSVRNLWVLPSGPPPDFPAESLLGERMAELLTQVRQQMDFVLIDGPPLLPLADSLVLASYVDGVLLVADAQRTRRGALTQSRAVLAQVDTDVLGTVLNNVDGALVDPAYMAYGYYAWGEDDQGAGPGRPAVRRKGGLGTGRSESKERTVQLGFGSD